MPHAGHNHRSRSMSRGGLRIILCKLKFLTARNSGFCKSKFVHRETVGTFLFWHKEETW